MLRTQKEPSLAVMQT